MKCHSKVTRKSCFPHSDSSCFGSSKEELTPSPTPMVVLSWGLLLSGNLEVLWVSAAASIFTEKMHIDPISSEPRVASEHCVA
jgi:hypothetical protein